MIPKVAVLFNPFVGILLTTFCGVTIPYGTLIEVRSPLYLLCKN